MAGDRGLAGAAFLDINCNGPHALEAPIRTVVGPMVMTAIVGIRSRIAPGLFIGCVAAPSASATIFAVAGDDGPRNQGEKPDRQ